MGRIMALDVGRIRIGIALSDIMQIIASPLETYKTCGRDEDTDYIIKLANEKEVDYFVVGLPLMLDGSESRQTELTRIFANLLEKKSQKKVVFVDERLTSVQADSIMLEANLKREKRKENIDKIAAAIILQEHLDNKK